MKVPKHFLVVVPGFMGSKLRDKNTGEMVWVDFSSIPLNPFQWEKWLDRLFSNLAYPNDALEPVGIMDEVLFIPPWAKQEHYGRLIKLLERMGYKADPRRYKERELNVYIFSYDWRQDNRHSAQQMANAMEKWKSYHPKSKAWVIAHSNGGLVSRWYIEKEGGKDTVGRLFLFGSPRDGAPRAFQILDSGLDTLFRRRFALFNITERTKEVLRTFPCAYQLIPVKNPFLRDIYNERIDPFTDMTWLGDEEQKRLLHDGRQFILELGEKLSVETSCFFGRKMPTISSGLVQFAAGGNWSTIKWEATESGDGTVPEQSAVFAQAVSQYPFCVSHGDIYVNPAALEVLEWELYSKYLLVKQALLVNKFVSIHFKTDKDLYHPGEKIKICINIQENKEEGIPISGAQIQAHLVWRQTLPGEVPNVPLQKFSKVKIIEEKQIPGKYTGYLIAPEYEGYYTVNIIAAIPGQTPTLLKELIIIEAESVIE